MILRTVSALSLMALSAPALAAADVTASVSVPSSTVVYGTGRTTVTVTNVGNMTASGVTVAIQLPVTHTSPSVYLMGTVGSMSSGCTRTGSVINCSLGSIRKGRSTSVWFDMALPWSSEAMSFTATAAFSGESNTTNNSGSASAVLSYYSWPLSGDTAMLNEHCTGTGLTAWYECTLFPSAISSHSTTLVSDGSITFGPEGAGYTGDWWQDASDHLAFVYYDPDGFLVAEFDGNGVPGGCFEGLTTFTGSSYVAPYSVCPE